jgi:hypothetical protein
MVKIPKNYRRVKEGEFINSYLDKFLYKRRFYSIIKHKKLFEFFVDNTKHRTVIIRKEK